MDKFAEIRVPIAHDNPSIKRHEQKCVLCGKCKDVCKKKIGVAGYWKYDSEDIVCINCGQCAQVCPVGAIREQDDTYKLIDAINNPNKKVVAITSPATRVSLGELFGLEPGDFVAGKMASTLRSVGADYVFDVTFGADMTIMEEASELIERLNNDNNIPLFTSCCPAWVKFVETFYPQYIPNLSTCRSPIAMQSSIIKNYFAKKEGIKASDIYVVAVTPCVAKKFEAKREELSGFYGQDTDCVISVKELTKLIIKLGIDFNSLKDSEFDSPFIGSGAGLIFGASGGVTEAVVRTAIYLSNPETPTENPIEFKSLRGYRNVKTAKVKLCGKDIKLCVVFGTNSALEVLSKLKRLKIDMLEVMACPNGCVGGGGQPKTANIENTAISRAMSLYTQDRNSQMRFSHTNPTILKLYEEYLGSPLSEQAENLLHTTFKERKNGKND